MARRFLILANPVSGGGRSREIAPLLRDALAARGHEAELAFTTHKGNAGERAHAVEPGRYDALVAVGGDGTLNEVLNGLRSLAQPLALLPLGTANVLAKEVRLPRRPAELAALLDHGRPRPFAVATANARRFLLFCSVGLDARIVAGVEAARKGTGGMRRWIAPVLHTIRTWPLADLEVVADGETVTRDATQVLATRMRGYGGFLRLPRAIAWDDGALHLLAFRSRSRFAWAWKSALAILGRLEPSGTLLHRKVTRLTIRAAAPVPYQVDGDLAGTTPVEIALLGETVPLFTPL